MALLSEGYYYFHWGSSLDFAIVEYTDPEPESKWSLNKCLATAKANLNQPITTYGFPHFKRPNGSSMYDAMKSTGAIITDDKRKRHFIKESFLEENPRQAADLFDIVFEQSKDRVYLGSIDASGGASGSPVLQDGKIIGLLFAGDPKSAKQYVEGAALFTNINHIKKVLRDQGRPVSDWFDCE